MCKNKKILVISIIILCSIIILHFIVDSKNEPSFGWSGSDWKSTISEVGDGTAYQEISTTPATLERIFIGSTDSTNATLYLYDGTSSSDATSILHFTSGITKGVYDIGIDFDKGILATVSSILDAVFIYTPK